MSHHSGLNIRRPAWWLATVDATPGARLLLGMVAESCTHKRKVACSQVKLGELLHVGRRQVIRYVAELKAMGYLTVWRRGKKLTNVYRLSRALWARLTGRARPLHGRPRQELLTALGLTLVGYSDKVSAYVDACRRKGYGGADTLLAATLGRAGAGA